jgi:hypothetical protein
MSIDVLAGRRAFDKTRQFETAKFPARVVASLNSAVDTVDSQFSTHLLRSLRNDVRLAPHLPAGCSNTQVFVVASSNSHLLSKDLGMSFF